MDVNQAVNNLLSRDDEGDDDADDDPYVSGYEVLIVIWGPKFYNVVLLGIYIFNYLLFCKEF